MSTNLPSLVLEAAGSFTVTVLPEGRVRISATDVQMPERTPPMDIHQCARWLNTSVRNVRAWVAKSDNPIPHVKAGAKLRFHQADVEAWLEREKIIGQRVRRRQQSHTIT